VGLAQARDIRSSEGRALAQAAGSSLGETASRNLWASRRLAEARPSRLSEMDFRSKHHPLA